jgi:hypothetical protein
MEKISITLSMDKTITNLLDEDKTKTNDEYCIKKDEDIQKLQKR